MTLFYGCVAYFIQQVVKFIGHGSIWAIFANGGNRMLRFLESGGVMTVDEIEKELLGLDPRSRAELALKLLSSLEELSDSENELLWAEEGARRHNELVEGKASSRPIEEVVRNLRASLK